MHVTEPRSASQAQHQPLVMRGFWPEQPGRLRRDAAKGPLKSSHNKQMHEEPIVQKKKIHMWGSARRVIYFMYVYYLFTLALIFLLFIYVYIYIYCIYYIYSILYAYIYIIIYLYHLYIYIIFVFIYYVVVVGNLVAGRDR